MVIPGVPRLDALEADQLGRRGASLCVAMTRATRELALIGAALADEGPPDGDPPGPRGATRRRQRISSTRSGGGRPRRGRHGPGLGA